jgi:hypothetical protein
MGREVSEGVCKEVSSAKGTSTKKTSRTVKKVRSSRVAETIKILNASVEDTIAEEIITAEKRARRKRASPVKRDTRP